MTAGAELLSVHGLCVNYRGQRGSLRAVQDVSFSVRRGEIFGIVGESGSGKSTTIRAIQKLLPEPPAEIVSGEVRFGDAATALDLMRLPKAELRRIQGARIGMVFQDPQKALNPVMPIGAQIGEGLRYRERMTASELRARVLEEMRHVGIPDPERRLEAYPHELSGGLRQRVVIAAALIARPELLFADEPTTALDVTIQAQILRLLRGFRDEFGMSVVMVTHDLGVVAQNCHRVAVMQAGRIVEEGLVQQVFAAPTHPYTQALLSATRLRKNGRQEKFRG